MLSELSRSDFPANPLEKQGYVLDFSDNVKTRTIYQSPQYPMQIMLGIFELLFEGAWNGMYNPADPYPKSFTIDYVRGYQPIGGYSNSGSQK